MLAPSTTLPPSPRVTHRVPVGMALRQVLLMTRRNLMRIRTNPAELAGMLLMPVMFIGLFVFVFGGAIAGSTAAYIQFAIPGIIAQGVVMGSTASGTGLNNDLNNGVFDRIRTLPIARWSPLVGQILGDLCRIALGIVITFGIGMALGFRVHTGPLQTVIAFVALFLFAFAFTWIPILLGVLAKSPVVVQTLSMVIIFPLTFGSSVFVPTQTFPGWLEAWAKISPMSAVANLTRGLMVGGAVATPALETFLWGVGVICIFAPLSAWAYRRRV
ncbi:MAG: ABC transporter permease [Candidatus Dormibacteraceae bacterium]